jgi:outer membrane protein insertion porin family
MLRLIPIKLLLQSVACGVALLLFNSNSFSQQSSVYPYPQPSRTGQGGPVARVAQFGFGAPQSNLPTPPQTLLPPASAFVPQAGIQPNGGTIPNGAFPNQQVFQSQALQGSLFPQQALPQPGFQQQQNFTGGPQIGFNPNGINAGGIGPNGIPQGAIPADIDIILQRAPVTGRVMAGGTYGSDNGFVGELILDERDFNIWAYPRSLSDLSNPRTWRGLGQSLRAEIVPGADLERYLLSFGAPYFLNTPVSLNVSGYFFDRQFFDWDEQRAGMKLRLGRSLTNFLSIQGGLQLENVEIDNLRLGTSPQLNANVGNSNLFTFDLGFVYDTRQSPYMLDSGSYLAATYRQAFGDYSFARGEIDYRTQRLLFKRTATTGHHTVSYRTKLGFSGSSTPVFENFFAGGFSSMRGFDFRGVGPVDGGVRVGGEFQWLNSLEYQFPVTYDDMIMAVAFVDFGTVEEDIDLNSDNFRIAPGVGLRVNLPFAGMSAPLAIDFAFPTDEAAGDDKQTISFMLGVVR